MKVRTRFRSIPRQNGTLSVPPYPYLMQIEYFQSNYTNLKLNLSIKSSRAPNTNIK